MKEQVDKNMSRALLYVNQKLKKNDVYKDLDKLYDFLNNGIDVLNTCIEIIKDNKDKIQNNKIKEILLELENVILNNLNEIVHDTENPIVYERQLILSTTVLKIKEYILNQTNDLCKNYKIPRICTKESAIDSINEVVADFFDEMYENILEIIRTKICSIESREEIKKYIKKINGLKTTLEPIIILQIDTLIDKYNLEELNIVDSIINELKELYNKCIIEEEKYNEMVSSISSSQINEIIEKKEITEIIEENMLSNSKKIDEIIDYIELNNGSITSFLVNHMNDELQKCIDSTIKGIKKESSKFQLLSCIAIEIIDDALNKILKYAETIRCTDESKKIVEGIKDSMCLKSEILREKDTIYQMRKKEDIIYYEKQLLEYKNSFTNKIPVFLDNAIQGSNEDFLNGQEKYNRLAEKLVIENTQRDIKYFRDDFLFEIITLEEIVRISLPKLISLEGDRINTFVEIVEGTYERISRLLEKNSIEEIYPKEHDKFNGLEHEIIYAETNEEYKKGTIIKVHTKGYRYNNNIILRANVIAAK